MTPASQHRLPVSTGSFCGSRGIESLPGGERRTKRLDLGTNVTIKIHHNFRLWYYCFTFRKEGQKNLFFSKDSSKRFSSKSCSLILLARSRFISVPVVHEILIGWRQQEAHCSLPYRRVSTASVSSSWTDNSLYMSSLSTFFFKMWHLITNKVDTTPQYSFSDPSFCQCLSKIFHKS